MTQAFFGVPRHLLIWRTIRKIVNAMTKNSKTCLQEGAICDTRALPPSRAFSRREVGGLSGQRDVHVPEVHAAQGNATPPA